MATMLTRIDAPMDILQRLELEIRVTRKRLQELEKVQSLILELRAAPIPDFDEEEDESESPRPLLGAATLRSLQEDGLRLADAAEIVLRQAGQPLSVAEIAHRLTVGSYKGSKATAPDQLRNIIRATLFRETNRAGSLFIIAERGLYGLRDGSTGGSWHVAHARVADPDSVYNEPAVDSNASTAGETPENEDLVEQAI